MSKIRPCISSQILDIIITKWTFCIKQFFSAKNYLQSSYYKKRVQPLLFFFISSFPSPHSFFLSFPFPSLLWFWSFSGLRNMPFDAFSLKWLQMSLGWFSKNRLDVHQHTSTTFKLVLEILREHSTQSGATDFYINY